MGAKTNHPDALTLDRVFGNLAQDGEDMSRTRIREAMGITPNIWKRRLEQYPQGSLDGILDPKLLITAARYWDINPVEVLVECGVFSRDTAVEYVDRLRGETMPHPPQPRTKSRRLRDLDVKDEGRGLA